MGGFRFLPRTGQVTDAEEIGLEERLMVRVILIE